MREKAVLSQVHNQHGQKHVIEKIHNHTSTLIKITVYLPLNNGIRLYYARQTDKTERIPFLRVVCMLSFCFIHVQTQK